MDGTLLSTLRSHAARSASSACVATGDYTVTYKRLLDAVDDLARTLEKLEPTFVTTTDIRHPADFVTAALAAIQVGKSLVVCAPEPHADKQVQQDLGELIRLESASNSPLALTAVTRGAATARAPSRNAPPECEVVLYTSGTTGRPVGIRCSLASFQINAEDMAKALRLHEIREVALCAPWYTSYGLSLGIMLPLALGLTIKPFRYGHPSALASRVSALRDAALVTTPPVYRSLAQIDSVGLRVLRLCLSSGDKLVPDVAREFTERHPAELFDCYGTTETNGIAISESSGSDTLVPLPSVSIRFCKTHGDDQEAPTTELMVAGPKLMRGYVHANDSAEQRLCDSWFRTLDYVERRPGGAFEVTGRASSLLKVGAKRVHTEEIERHLESIEGVEEALVSARSHPEQGQVVEAMLRVSGPGIKLATVRARIAQALPPHMVPRHVSIVDAIPRSAGKKARHSESSQGKT